MKKIIILLILVLNFTLAKQVSYQSIQGCSKPSSYLTMSYRMDDNNSISNNIDISISFLSENDTKILSIDVKEDKELNILTLDKSYKELENRDSYDINITAQSLVEGKFYITLYTKTTYSGALRHKSFIIPIQVGTIKIKDSKSDNSFVIYKGMETISPR